ncbi:MAG: filamentous hemagglutinin N-terminal domain-containing protein [Brasilonema octagenarum HA4186-MV1]|jgi:filamentous hemagglutinin family protein|nr:filamentous hemagglutinin N-terminal domain-containing protein [Brasilonema octagenarum HA4186-MV1]
MSFRSTRWFLGIAVGGAFSLAANSASAQITPDTTLPNNSTVTINGNTFNIDGGTQAGRNLFHSFQQFSVQNGNTASFNNALDIQNIFSRVTGPSVSNIDGIIKALGTANLFLINPNGIIFGPNASLNVGGCFVGTTANAIQFGNQGFFSASEPNNPALLTVNPSVLFFNQLAAASIKNNSVAPVEKNPAGLDTFGLRVPDGKSLLLVGGNISMDGGKLNAFGGRVELGGLAASGNVGLNVDGDKLSLDFPASSTRADISLTNRAVVDVRTDGGGDIAINSRNLELSGNSRLSAGIREGLGNPEAKAGDITVNATGDINIIGDSGIGNTVLGTGNAGNIILSSNSLSLANGTYTNGLAIRNYGQGNPGNIIINATKSVSLDDDSEIFNEVGSIYTSPEDRNAIKGNGGNIQITTSQLSLNDSQLSATIFGQGNAGNVIINATKSVSLDNANVFTTVGSVVDGPEERNATKANGGNIQITTSQLSLTNNSQLQAGTFGQGDSGSVIINATKSVSLDGTYTDSDGRNFPSAIFTSVGDAYDSPEQRNAVRGNGGNIEITTPELSLTNRAAISADTNAQGNAGNVIINATKSVSLDGGYTNSNGGISRSNISSNVGDVKDTPEQRNAIKGNGGNIEITTSQLSVTNGAALEASTFAQGNAGTIKVNAAANVTISDKISNLKSGLYVNSQSPTGTAGDIIVTSPRVTLDNSGTLNAESATGNGGNINLQTDLLLLRRGAQISTTAGTAQQRGDGGNITINAPNGFIVSVPNENSDITANAFNGSGGVIKINALNIYNFTQRSLSDLENLLGTEDPTKLDTQQLPTNDITAISLTSPALSGQVNIITSFDPNRGLVELPAYVFDPSNQIAQGCSAFDQPNASDFQVTGRGGLPPTPDKPLSSDAVWEDTRLGATTPQRLDSKTTATKPKSESDTVEIIPATGWVFNGKGEVTLVSNGSSTNNLGTTAATCPGR